jgi:serine/threonine protein kinase
MVAMDSIGRYRLVRRIGAGSFATVWLGNDDDLDVPVAVKVLADN